MDQFSERMFRTLWYIVFYAIGFMESRRRPEAPTALALVSAALGVLTAELLYSGSKVVWKRALTVSAIVSGLCKPEQHDLVRWKGSRVRLWLLLFLLGRAENADGLSVDLTMGSP